MMNRKYSHYGVLSIVGLIVVLGIALGFDALVTFLRRNISTFPLGGEMWLLSSTLTNLFLGAFLLLLFWFVINRAPRNVWVALIFLLTGLYIAAYPVLYFKFHYLDFLPPQLGDLLATARSYIFYLGGCIAMTGLFALVFPRGKEKNL